MSLSEIVLRYAELGYLHVIPLGFDHILFILSIYLLNSSLKSVVIQCSIFTLAHSLSLGIATIGLFIPNSNIIEPLIAFSIVVTSIENLLHSKVYVYRLAIIFLFGLIHGLGFASALLEQGLDASHFLASLVAFNVGVELGQLTVIVAMYVLVVKWFCQKNWYHQRVVYPISTIIGSMALYWTIDRIVNAV